VLPAKLFNGGRWRDSGSNGRREGALRVTRHDRKSVEKWKKKRTIKETGDKKSTVANYQSARERVSNIGGRKQKAGRSYALSKAPAKKKAESTERKRDIREPQKKRQGKLPKKAIRCEGGR